MAFYLLFSSLTKLLMNKRLIFTKEFQRVFISWYSGSILKGANGLLVMF